MSGLKRSGTINFETSFSYEDQPSGKWLKSCVEIHQNAEKVQANGLKAYKFIMFFSLLDLMYISMTAAFEPTTAKHFIEDNFTTDRRIQYSIYWLPSFVYLYLKQSVIASPNQTNLKVAIIVGVLNVLYHIGHVVCYLIVQSPSKDRYPSYYAFIYWGEIVLNLTILIFEIALASLMSNEEQKNINQVFPQKSSTIKQLDEKKLKETEKNSLQGIVKVDKQNENKQKLKQAYNIIGQNNQQNEASYLIGNVSVDLSKNVDTSQNNNIESKTQQKQAVLTKIQDLNEDPQSDLYREINSSVQKQQQTTKKIDNQGQQQGSISKEQGIQKKQKVQIELNEHDNFKINTSNLKKADQQNTDNELSQHTSQSKPDIKIKQQNVANENFVQSENVEPLDRQFHNEQQTDIAIKKQDKKPFISQYMQLNDLWKQKRQQGQKPVEQQTDKKQQ